MCAKLTLTNLSLTAQQRHWLIFIGYQLGRELTLKQPQSLINASTVLHYNI